MLLNFKSSFTRYSLEYPVKEHRLKRVAFWQPKNICILKNDAMFNVAEAIISKAESREISSAPAISRVYTYQTTNRAKNVDLPSK